MYWLLVLIPIVIIFYQDIKYRHISWWTIPLIPACIVVRFIDSYNLSVLSNNLLINESILFFEIIVLTIYFSIKNKQFINICQSYLGLGDILFFAVTAPFFFPIHFLVFQISGLLFCLLVSSIVWLIKKDWTFTIPLAGIFSILFFGYLLLLFTADVIYFSY